jgi:translation initiation factor 2 gamma subunit (eIF-2gamma)
MEAETDSVFSVSVQTKPEQIKVKIGFLIRLYVSYPESIIAEAVAKQIGEMLVDPDCIDDIEQRCLYRQLEMHWRCLGWINSHCSTESSQTKIFDSQIVR